MTPKPYSWLPLFSLTAMVAFTAQVTPTGGAPQSRPTQSSTAQVQPETKTLGPDLPLSAMPTRPAGVCFVVEHRSALNRRTVRVHGIVAAALLGAAACPPDRGMCMPPSIILSESEPGKNRPACSVRILVSKDAKQQDYPIGKAAEVRATVDGHATGVVLTRVD
ncbi:MAG TPA: hypothetical protein VN950_23785 [Terriglobales bacterium]|nr:hypothetical protein [Terriglobales bacterium]